MKTVVIGEAPRSGKSLLAHSIYDSIKTSVTHLDMLCGCAHKSFQDSFQDHEDPDEIFGLIDDYQDFLIRVIKNSGHEFDYVRVFESTFIGPAELSKSINNQEYIRIGSQLACESDAVRKRPESPRRLVLRRDAMWIDAWRVPSENNNK